jgi:hypothetical protein
MHLAPHHLSPEHPMKTPCLALHLVAAMLMTAPWQAHADAFHSSPGLAGSMVGYAQPLSSNLTLRADLVSTPGAAGESIEVGASYTGHIKSDRGALFMDWYVVGNMRLTGGMTFSRTRVDLRAGAHGGAPMLGDVPYGINNNDRLDLALRSPHTLPYLGVGYGQYNASGSSFLFDIGGSFGRASLSDTPSGPSLAAESQTTLDHELAQLRDGIGRVRFMPQVSLGMNLRF